MSNFFDDFFAPKTVFWKNHYWGGSGIDCFEPIFRFLMQFCFQKHRSGTWNPKDMFSAPSWRSDKSQIITRSNVFHHLYLLEVNVHVQNSHGVLDRLVPCILRLVCSRNSMAILNLQIRKTDDEKVASRNNLALVVLPILLNSNWLSPHCAI